VTTWLLGALLLSAAPKAPPESALVLTTEVLERLPLPVAPRAVSFDVWRREVRLITASPAAVARALEASRLCPQAEVRDGAAVARCKNGRLVASLGRGRRGVELSLAQLRGVPRDDAPSLGTSWHYPPERFGLGGACPGTTPEGKAECLLAQRRPDEAVPLLTEALQHGNGDFAALRLGDIALAKGDILGALARYQAAGRKDNWGRLAAMRLCELVGCEREESVFDSARLPEPLATEVELRLARTLALRGEDRRAALALLRRLADRARPPVCPSWPAVCAGVALVNLCSDDLELEALGLEVFLHFQQQVGTSQDTVLVRAAAEAAARLGAPAFAANLLATATPAVPRTRLVEHLSRVVTFYEAAGDRLRADVVRDYARVVVKRPLRVKSPTPPPPDGATVELEAKLETTRQRVSVALELAHALATVGRSRASAVLGAGAVLGPAAGAGADDAAAVEEAARDGGVTGAAGEGVAREPGARAASASSP
jgi:hypothetical protein